VQVKLKLLPQRSMLNPSHLFHSQGSGERHLDVWCVCAFNPRGDGGHNGGWGDRHA